MAISFSGNYQIELYGQFSYGQVFYGRLAANICNRLMAPSMIKNFQLVILNQDGRPGYLQ